MRLSRPLPAAAATALLIAACVPHKPDPGPTALVAVEEKSTVGETPGTPPTTGLAPAELFPAVGVGLLPIFF
jgi:hypothetical protein